MARGYASRKIHFLVKNVDNFDIPFVLAFCNFCTPALAFSAFAPFLFFPALAPSSIFGFFVLIGIMAAVCSSSRARICESS